MEWFNVVKRRKKSMQGNIPHLYQWLTRLVRPASEHTKEYLDKYCAWEDLPNGLREYMKDFVFRGISSNIPKQSKWGRREPIPGIKLHWTGNNFTVDEDAYNDWRTAQGGSHSDPLSWQDSHRVDMIYDTIQRELKYCLLYKHNRQDEIDYHYNSRYYDGSWSNKTKKKQAYYHPGAWTK